MHVVDRIIMGLCLLGIVTILALPDQPAKGCTTDLECGCVADCLE